MHAYPGGIVPSFVAAKMLGVSIQQVRRLIADGRLVTVPAFDELPDMTFIPVDNLPALPSRLEQGRPLGPRKENGIRRREERQRNPWPLDCGKPPHIAPAVKNVSAPEDDDNPPPAKDLGNDVP